MTAGRIAIGRLAFGARATAAAPSAPVFGTVVAPPAGPGLPASVRLDTSSGGVVVEAACARSVAAGDRVAVSGSGSSLAAVAV